MMALLAINVILLIIDAIFGNITVQRALREHFPGPSALYDTRVHQNFVLIDGVFLTIFMVEFCVRWLIATRRKRYHRWFFYPLIHWYDLLGCLPVSSLRFLRGLRLVAMVYRLHRLGRIDVRKYYLYRVFEKYRDIVTEEISDRVVLHVLTGMQGEVKQGSPVVERIWREVVAPHKDAITGRVVSRAEQLLKEQTQHQRPQIRGYVEDVLDRSLERSRHVFLDLERIPVLGKRFTEQIERAIKVIVSQVIIELFHDAEKIDVQRIATTIEQALSEAFAARDARIEEMAREALHESIQIIKDEVSVQQWKLRELAEKTGEGSVSTA